MQGRREKSDGRFLGRRKKQSMEAEGKGSESEKGKRVGLRPLNTEITPEPWPQCSSGVFAAQVPRIFRDIITVPF